MLYLASWLLYPASAQQYGWKNITDSLPDFFNDTVVINNGADTLIANLRWISFIDDNHQGIRKKTLLELIRSLLDQLPLPQRLFKFTPGYWLCNNLLLPVKKKHGRCSKDVIIIC